MTTTPGMFGMSVHVNIFNCEHDKICDIEYIKKWMDELCTLIGMKRHGDMIYERFGSEPHLYGYSVVQLIETSSITAHFSEEMDSCYIDIFSCKKFDGLEAAKFCSDVFGGLFFSFNVIER